MPPTLMKNHLSLLELQVTRQKTNHIRITRISFFSYLIIGATSSKHNGATNHTQLTPTAELNDKPITHKTKSIVTTRPHQSTDDYIPPLPINPQAY